MINPELKAYIESEIIPRYDHFDGAHTRGHVEMVICQSLKLAAFYDVDEDVIYTAAAYHDTGMVEGRETHHLVSGRIIREDACLRKWLDAGQIETAAQAAEDHRASSKAEPRTIYGRILAEADRTIDPELIIRRTVQFGFDHYPEMTEEQHIERALEHLHEKYGRGGYLRLWIPESDNSARLEDLRKIIDNSSRLRAIVEQEYLTESQKRE
ncbi:MAG: HD domain-containing protein [Bacteroidales bacterium]|nr:HD domain-containing protein [Candidatus Equibacterium intestinale]